MLKKQARIKGVTLPIRPRKRPAKSGPQSRTRPTNYQGCPHGYPLFYA
nr:MAG TPA: hypothetical protein [Caudoviricetes sp.]